jgi:surface antigen
MPFGHVAIITDVMSDYVHIAEQNNLYNYWPGDYARRAPLRFENGRYYIDDQDKIYGWMEIEDNGQLQPFDESNKDKIHDKYIYREPIGIFARLFSSNKKKDSK